MHESPDAVVVDSVSKTYRLWEDSSGPVRFALANMLSKMTGRTRKTEGYFQTFHALTNVSFSTKQGESFAIIGRNGSGKSTLLQIIAGTLRATSGSATVNGRVAALLELGSGFNPDFTGRENVFLNASILGLSREQAEQRFESIAQFADIGEFMEQPVKIYSSGMALRLAFAVIAHIDATILIVDEALAVGDVYFMQKCMRFLRSFRERGTLLFVSHDMSSVRALCNTALWLEKGSMRMIGSAQDVAAAYLAESNLSQANADVAQVVEPAGPRESPPPRIPDAGKERYPIPMVNVQNVLDLAPFNENSHGYGDGRVRIIDVRFADSNGAVLSILRGGDVVSLLITARAIEATGNVLFGFNLKDRLGQYLFGENTYHSAVPAGLVMQAGECLRARFTFQMPVLHQGHYSIVAAVASGTPENHRQQHWMHEALLISSGTDWAHAGLIGLPMLEVAVEKA